MRLALFADIVTIALGTLRTNKMRSVLTVLGVVIGITSIVGMTSLVRGFDESLRDSIRELGPKTIFLAKFSGISFASGNEFKDLIKRPVLTVDDARAIEREAATADKVDVWLGIWGIPTMERIFYKGEKTKALSVWGVTENYAEVNFLKLETGRFFTGLFRDRLRLGPGALDFFPGGLQLLDGKAFGLLPGCVHDLLGAGLGVGHDLV